MMVRITEIGFTDEQLDRIIEYKNQAEAVSLQVAILNAISVASDRLEFIDDTVVRCKDCSFRNEINCPQYYRRSELHDDWFCADGERKMET